MQNDSRIPLATVTALGLIMALSPLPVLAQTLRTAAEEADETVELDEVKVSGASEAAETGYLAPSNSGRTTAQPRDIAKTITSYTSRLIQDQNIRNNNQLLRGAPGVDNVNPEFGTVRIRGFNAQISIDGISTPNFVGRTDSDLSAFEQVEIIKGPASLGQGTGSPGGTVNYAFKRPKDHESFETSLGFSNPRGGLLTVDYNIKPAFDGRLRARIVGSYENRNLFTHPDSIKRLSLYGVAEFDVTDRTTLRLGYWRQRNESVQSFRLGLPTYDDYTLIPFDLLPVGTTLTQDWNNYQFKSDWLNVDLEHDFGGGWRGKLSYRRGESFHPSHYASTNCRGPLAAQGYGNNGIDKANPNWLKCMGAEFYSDHQNTELVDANIAGAFELFGRSHDVVAGLTHEKSWFRRQLGSHNTADEFLNDISNPNPHVSGPLPLGPITPLPPRGAPSVKVNAYVAATINVTDQLRFPISVRTTSVRGTNGVWSVRDHLTPTLGVLYDVTPDITVYGQYAKMFTPNTSNRSWDPSWAPGVARDPNVEGILLPHVTGVQKEIGIKAMVFGGRALLTASAFDLREQNRAMNDPENTPTGQHPSLGTGSFRIAAGEIRSRGVELGLSGEIAPGWNLSAGYAYVDARYGRDNTLTGRPIGTSRHSGNIWTNYTFQQGRLAGLSLGAGIRFKSSFHSSPSATAPSIQAPGYGVVSARAAYQINDNFSASLHIENLFNKNYYETVNSRGGNNYHGESRRISATLNARF